VLVHAVNDAAPTPVLDTQVPTTGDDSEDSILEATDKALVTFSWNRQLLLDMGKDAFFEHAWKVKCVDTILRDGRVYVTVETIAGETPALTKQDKGKRFDLPVSRGKDLRDANLRRALELCMPNVRTMQGLFAYCAAPASYPSFEGEKQKNSKRAKDVVVRIKGTESLARTSISTLSTIPRWHASSYRTRHRWKLKEGELVELIRVRRNKNNTYLECRFIAPEQKTAKKILASIEMSNAPKGQRSVRDILNVMHNIPSTLNVIFLTHSKSDTRREASSLESNATRLARCGSAHYVMDG